jgi:hypothetical protein
MTNLKDYWPPSEPTAVETPRRCRRHDWFATIVDANGEVIHVANPGPLPHREAIACRRCLTVRDDAKARRGRNNRKRGNAIELAVAKAVGGKRTGQYGGKDDVLADALFAYQVKSRQTGAFPGWMTTELDVLRTARQDREPVLVVAEAPGPGRKARRLYVVDEKTWLALHGGPRNE